MRIIVSPQFDGVIRKQIDSEAYAYTPNDRGHIALLYSPERTEQTNQCSFDK